MNMYSKLAPLECESFQREQKFRERVLNMQRQQVLMSERTNDGRYNINGPDMPLIEDWMFLQRELRTRLTKKGRKQETALISEITVRALFSEDLNENYAALRTLRQLKKRPSFSELVNLNIVPRLVEFLRGNRPSYVQLQTIMILTYITGGGGLYTSAVVQAGALPLLISLLCSENQELQEEAVSTLGNIAADFQDEGDDDDHGCDLMLRQGALPKLLDLMVQRMESPSLVREIVTALNRLCYAKEWKAVYAKLCVSSLNKVLKSSNDTSVLIEVCSLINYLIRRHFESLLINVIESNLCEYLVRVLENDNNDLTRITLKVLECISAKCRLWLHLTNIRQVLRPLLKSNNLELRGLASSVFINIIYETDMDINEVIENGIFVTLLKNVENGPMISRYKAASNIIKVLQLCSLDRIQELMCPDCVRILCSLLIPSTDNDILLLLLEALEYGLKMGIGKSIRGENPHLIIVKEYCDINKLMELRNCDNIMVSRLILKICNDYFVDEEEEDDMTYKKIRRKKRSN